MNRLFGRLRLSLYILIIFGGTLSGQNEIGKELKMIRDTYAQTSYFTFDVEAYSYATKSDKLPSLLGKGSAKKSTNCYYSNFAGYEFVMNGNQSLVVDNNNKSISVYDVDAKMKNITDINIDSLSALADSISFQRLKSGQKHFVFYSKGGYVFKTEVFADPGSNFITKILYHYVPSNQEFEIGFDRVEVYYKNITTKDVGKNVFAFENYISNDKSVMKPVGKYKNYVVKYFNTKK